MKKILHGYTSTKADLRTIALYYEKEYYETIGIEGGRKCAYTSDDTW